MTDLILCIDQDGDARAICDDEHEQFLQALGSDPPQRASTVEPIRAGPFAWWWAVDLSPLGEGYGYCLWPPLASRRSALVAEYEHVLQHWVLHGRKS